MALFKINFFLKKGTLYPSFQRHQQHYTSSAAHHQHHRLERLVCVVATELALVQCFAIRFLTNPKTIMQS